MRFPHRTICFCFTLLLLSVLLLTALPGCTAPGKENEATGDLPESEKSSPENNSGGSSDMSEATTSGNHSPSVTPGELSEFYDTVNPEVDLHFEFEDDQSADLAGRLILKPLSAEGKGTYQVCYGDEKGILPGYQPFGKTFATAPGKDYTVFTGTRLSAAPVGAVTVVALDKKGKAAAFARIPENKQRTRKPDSSFAALSDVHIFLDEPYNGDYASINGFDDTDRAVEKLKNMDLTQISITGDLILSFVTDNGQIKDELSRSTSQLKKFSCPVYVVKGNHDKMVREADWRAMTGCEPDYYRVEGDTYCVYLSLRTVHNVDSIDASPYGNAKIDWLQGVLEEAKGKRVLLFMHYPFFRSAGLIPGERYGFAENSQEEARIRQLIDDHGAVTVFNGHTHYDFQSTKVYPQICASRLGTKNTYAVHIPSLAYPRNSSGTTITGESQGYIVGVYPDGLLLNGYDFTTGEFVPYAVWYLDTREQSNVLTEYGTTLEIGQRYQISAKNAYSSASFRSADESVATVNEKGVVTAVSGGRTTVRAQIDGFNYYFEVKVRDHNDASGSGTKEDPFRIGTADQFVHFQSEIKNGETYKGQFFELMSDINLNDCESYAPFTEATGGSFEGFFDGRGHVITVKTQKDSASFAVPYFWNVAGTIVNTGFDCDMGGCSSTSYIVARTMNKGTFVNCFVTGSIAASNVNTTIVCGTSSGTILQNVYIDVSLTGTTPGKSESGISMKGSGKVAHIYYVPNGCTPQFGETAVENGSDVAELLNASRAASAETAGIGEELLCLWEEQNGRPVLIASDVVFE